MLCQKFPFAVCVYNVWNVISHELADFVYDDNDDDVENMRLCVCMCVDVAHAMFS